MNCAKKDLGGVSHWIYFFCQTSHFLGEIACSNFNYTLDEEPHVQFIMNAFQ